MTLSKKNIMHLVAALWIVFSLVYIFYDIWSDFKLKELNQAYQQGRVETINALITEAEKCQPFPVFSGEKQIQLIKTDCPALTK
jgi:hypothetical protein